VYYLWYVYFRMTFLRLPQNDEKSKDYYRPILNISKDEDTTLETFWYCQMSSIPKSYSVVNFADYVQLPIEIRFFFCLISEYFTIKALCSYQSQIWVSARVPGVKGSRCWGLQFRSKRWWWFPVSFLSVLVAASKSYLLSILAIVWALRLGVFLVLFRIQLFEFLRDAPLLFDNVNSLQMSTHIETNFIMPPPQSTCGIRIRRGKNQHLLLVAKKHSRSEKHIPKLKSKKHEMKYLTIAIRQNFKSSKITLEELGFFTQPTWPT